MIKAQCYTNLDNFRCNVTAFSALPRVGDYVEVLYNDIESSLRITKITHKQLTNGEPIIEVELHN